MTLHVHAPLGVTLRKRFDCTTCKRVTRFVVTVFEWYEPTMICCACGERWQGRERAARPFARGWRQRSIEHARKLWRQAVPEREGHAAVRAMFLASVQKNDASRL